MADPNDAYSPWPTDRPERPGWYDRFADLAQKTYGPLAWSTFPTTDQARVRLNSFSGGFGDELLGGLASLTGGDYAQTRDRERAGVRRAWDQDPGSAARETIYGTLPWFAAPASLAGQAAPWLGRLAGYAGMGGLQGGVSGFGEGEGGVGERARHAASGALTGAAMMGVPFLGYHAAKAFPAAAAGVAGGALGSLVPSEAQAGPVPKGFFSVLEEALRGSKAKSMPAEQWSAYLAPGRREVTVGDLKFPLRDEELKWSGLPGYLEGKQPGERIPVDELLKQVQDRPLPDMQTPKGRYEPINMEDQPEQLQEIIPGLAERASNNAPANSEHFDDRFEDLLNILHTPSSTQRLRDLRAFEREHGVQADEAELEAIVHRRVATPGGQYKQHVLLGPTTGYGEELTKFNPETGRLAPDEVKEYTDWLKSDRNVPGAINRPENRRMLELFQRNEQANNPAFTSSHFGGEGEDLLSHSRWSRRRTDDGKPVHLVEEIQSDWHQQGREWGYRGQDTSLSPDEQAELTRLAGRITRHENTPEDYTRYSELVLRRNKQLDEGPPMAPFSKTYHELELKKNLARAVANGDEYLALTTGTQQANRWNQLLQKDLDAVGWYKSSGGIQLMPYKKGSTVAGPAYNAKDESKLRGLIGKEMADKIMKGDREGKLTGDNLSIGGAGMRHTYDEVYRGYLDKLAKQYGGEFTQIPIKVAPGTVNPTKDLVPAIRITDKMRDRVKRHGLPLFSAPAATGAAGLTGYLGLRPPEDDLPN